MDSSIYLIQKETGNLKRTCCYLDKLLIHFYFYHRIVSTNGSEIIDNITNIRILQEIPTIPHVASSSLIWDGYSFENFLKWRQQGRILKWKISKKMQLSCFKRSKLLILSFDKQTLTLEVNYSRFKIKDPARKLRKTLYSVSKLN